MTNVIRMAEVWVPSADGSVLEPSGGIYDAAPAFGALTRQMCFGHGEGLPGHVWDERKPVLLDPLEGTYFVRTKAARAAGVRSAIGLPVLAGDTLTSVVLLFCGAAEDGDAVLHALAQPGPSRGSQTWLGNLRAASATSVARRVERWLPGAAGTLRRDSGCCEVHGELGFEANGRPHAALGPLGAAATSGVAQVGTVPVLGPVLALPLFDGDVLAEVMAFYV